MIYYNSVFTFYNCYSIMSWITENEILWYKLNELQAQYWPLEIFISANIFEFHLDWYKANFDIREYNFDFDEIVDVFISFFHKYWNKEKTFPKGWIKPHKSMKWN